MMRVACICVLVVCVMGFSRREGCRSLRQTARPVKWDVYILAGQSNASTNGSAADLTREQARPQPDTRYWMEYWQAGAIVSETHGWSVVGPLQTGFGTALEFAHSMALAGRHAAVIQYAYGGSPMASWLGGQLHLYPELLRRVRDGVLGLSDYRFAGLLWVHGEGDSTLQASAESYAANLRALVALLRSDLLAPTLPVVLNRLHIDSDAPFVSTVRDQQDAFVAADDYAAIYSVDDTALKVDNVHWTSATHLAAGARAATAMLGLL